MDLPTSLLVALLLSVSGLSRSDDAFMPEDTWIIVSQPRCCSDCTFVSRGFKCKVKSCLNNCPWAQSADAIRKAIMMLEQQSSKSQPSLPLKD